MWTHSLVPNSSRAVKEGDMQQSAHLGTGMGWRPEIAEAVERMPGLDWVEVVAENVCPGHIPDGGSSCGGSSGGGSNCCGSSCGGGGGGGCGGS